MVQPVNSYSELRKYQLDLKNTVKGLDAKVGKTASKKLMGSTLSYTEVPSRTVNTLKLKSVVEF